MSRAPRSKRERVAAIASRFIAMKPDFDFARDQDGNKCSTTKFCMVSLGEWDDIRALAASALLAAKPKRRRVPA